MKKLFVTLFVLALVATACGGGTSISVGPEDDATSDGSGDDGTAAQASQPADDESDDGGSGDDGGDDDGSGDDGGDDGGSGFSSSSFCAFAAERELMEDEFENLNFFDPEVVESAFEENLQLIAQAIDVAPPEIRGDLEIVRDDLQAVYEQFDAVDFDATQLTDVDFDDSAEVIAAGERIDQYVLDECGIDVNADTDSDSGDGGAADGGEQLVDGSGQDALIMSVLESLGFTGDQAACLADRLSLEDFEAMSTGDVQPEILNTFTECGVGLDDLAELGGADPDQINDDLDDALADVPEGSVDEFAELLVVQGFTEEEAACLAEEMLTNQANVGADLTLALESCNIPLSRMIEIGQG